MNNKYNGYYNERGFWVPFAIGGLAGGALGYGIANNNSQNKNYPVYVNRPPYMMMQPPFMPYYY